jgi:hypothetical protein
VVELWQPRAADPGVDDVLAPGAVLDQLQRRKRGRLPGRVPGLLDEPAGLDAADLLLVDAVVDPAEQPAVDEDRRIHGRVHLVVGADPRVALGEHVAGVDPDVARAVLERPLDDEVGAAGEEQDAGAEHDALAVLGLDRDAEVVGVDGHPGTGDPADRVHVVLVDRPQPRADHLVGDRVNVQVGGAVQLEATLDRQRFPRDIPLDQGFPAARILAHPATSAHPAASRLTIALP